MVTIHCYRCVRQTWHSGLVIFTLTWDKNLPGSNYTVGEPAEATTRYR